MVAPLVPYAIRGAIWYQGESNAGRAYQYRELMPALILMDMGLPVIDGWEATRRIKADPATAAIPVIALTAHAMAADRDKCLAAGCDDFDTKPVDIARLVGKIEALAGGETA